MGNFYLDIETTGLEPKKDKIITIQYQELHRTTGKAIGPLIILKEWESSEREMLDQFLRESGIMDDYPFKFIPVGYNLGFEHNFLRERTALYSLHPIDILNRPFIDLRAVGIIMNRGEFKGSGLDKISGKPTDGRNVPVWYGNKEYSKIEEYVKVETAEFIKLNSWLYREMPDFLERFRKEVLGRKKEE